MNKFFCIVNLPKPCPFILQNGQRFCLQLGIPNSSYEVFKTGFAHLGLLPGAEKLFKKESEVTILNLIQTAKRIEDLEVLANIFPKNKKLQKAVEVKRSAFITSN